MSESCPSHVSPCRFVGENGHPSGWCRCPTLRCQSPVRVMLVMSVHAGLWERTVIPVDVVIVERYDVRVISQSCQSHVSRSCQSMQVCGREWPSQWMLLQSNVTVSVMLVMSVLAGFLGENGHPSGCCRCLTLRCQSHVRVMLVMSVLAGLWERMVIPVDVIVERYGARVMSESC